MLWIKESGQEIETNELEATIKAAKANGWKPKEKTVKAATKVEVDKNVLKAAKACHDANRKYCKSIGDDSQPAWTKAEEWQQQSAINGVIHVMKNPDAKPEDSHSSWLSEKEADGWKYGEVKDVEKKEHPCFVPYDELPDEQKKKDEIFIETALSFIGKD